jgi:ribose transport system substrate-binding protein
MTQHPTLVLFVLLAACGREAPPEPTAAPASGGPQAVAATDTPRRRVAVIPKGTTHEFWKSVHAGANKAGKELGVEILWKGPVREDDRDEQVKVVENFIAERVDAIVLAPLDDKALVPAVRDAVGEKIPVVIIDSDLDWDGYVSFVATDNFHGGVAAAQRLGELLAGKGKVAMMLCICFVGIT